MAAPAQADADLARQLLAGDEGAFDRFVETYQRKIFQYSMLMCAQREDAEEVAQETLMKVFEKLDQLRDPAAMKTWVFRIARNACYMKRRKSTFAPAEELSLDQFLPSASSAGSERKLEIADWSALPDSQAISSEMRSILNRAIRELPDIYRGVIVLRDIEDLSTAQTAEVLDISEDTVKTRLHRARLAIRHALDHHLRAAEATS